MRNEKISLKEAVRFHGHLGPYIVLGVLAGEVALKKLRCRKYFGLQVKVWGANKKPKSCLVDGLQLSTGATYGKGNIRKMAGSKIKILFSNSKNNRRLNLYLKENVLKRLSALRGHRDSESFAKELYKLDPLNVFILNPKF